MNLEDFKKVNNKKKVSKLEDYKNEILELHDENFSLSVILKYLKSKDVDTCISNISRFITRKKGKLNSKKIEKASEEKIEKATTKANQLFKPLEKKGKDLEFAGTPDWAK